MHLWCYGLYMNMCGLFVIKLLYILWYYCTVLEMMYIFEFMEELEKIQIKAEIWYRPLPCKSTRQRARCTAKGAAHGKDERTAKGCDARQRPRARQRPLAHGNDRPHGNDGLAHGKGFIARQSSSPSRHANTHGKEFFAE